MTPPAVALKPSVPAAPSVVQTNAVTAVAASTDTGFGYKVALFLGLGALASALVIVVRIIARTRRPGSSLITSSMHDDLHQPPQK